MSSLDGDVLPAWFSSGLYAVLVWWSVAGISALILLARHQYHPVAVVIIATVAAAGAWHFRPRRRTDEPQAHIPALAAIAIALALLAVAGISHSEHLLTDRDPAIYINTGRSIARTHLVRPQVAPSPFDDVRTFSPSGAGFTIRNHRLQPNFLIFLPALLALAWSAGGDTAMLLLPALLGALALLALYALGTKIVGPRWALLGPVLLVLAPLQSWFARDAYTELPLQLFALGGIWLFLESREGGGPMAGAFAGLIVGTVMFVRIDALAVLIAIPTALVIEYLRAGRLDPLPRRDRRGALLAFALTTGITTWGGARMSQRLSPDYLRDLGSELHQLKLAFAAGVVFAVAIVVVHLVLPGIGRRLARSNTLLILAALGTIAVAIYAYRWRPRVGLPASFDTRVAHNAFYQSASFTWFAWYFGVFTLALIVLGFIVLGVRAVRTDSPAFFLLAATVPMTLLYIARPSIAPDHLWAMRRYLPIVLPGMLIAAAASARWITAAIDALWPRLRTPSLALVLAGMLVPTAIAGAPLVGAKMQGGALEAVHTVCHKIGPNAAIAVEPFNFLGAELPQTLRGFCGVPSMATRPDSPVSLRDYAAQWKAQGQDFYVITAGRKHLLKLVPDATQVAHLTIPDANEPDRTKDHRPDRYVPRPVELWLFRINSE